MALKEATGAVGGSREPSPTMVELFGYVVVMTPTQLDEREFTEKGKDETGKEIDVKVKKPAVKVDLLVLDGSVFGEVNGIKGGPLRYSGKKDQDPSDEIQLPALFSGVSIVNKNLVTELTSAFGDGSAPDSIYGVPYQSTTGSYASKPINLGKVGKFHWGDPRPDADKLIELVGKSFNAYEAGTLKVHTESTLIKPLPHQGPDVHKAYQERVKARQESGGKSAEPSPAPVDHAPQYAPGAPKTLTYPAPPGWDKDKWLAMDEGTRTMIASQMGLQPTSA